MTEDRESQILVVSATLDQAKAAVKLIKLFIDDNSADLPTSNVDIPWTIKNKYYSAEVHFHLVEYVYWDLQLARRVPAIIFVWTRGQPYAEQVFGLHKALTRFEPEVALAIALGSGPPHHDDPPEGPDSYLADHGFEYIDGERTRHLKSDDVRPDTDTDTADGEGEGDEDPVPGLPRVIDALSTIMWPSMVRRGRDDGGHARKGPAVPFDFDVLHTEEGGEEEETLAALMAASAADSGAPLTRATRMQREMATLERWLIENEEMHEAELGEPISSSPTGIDDDDAPRVPAVRATSGDPWLSHDGSTTQRGGGGGGGGGTPGFDDDFSAFVSAPAVSVSPAVATAGYAYATASASEFTLAATRAHGFSTPPPPPRCSCPHTTGGSYRSLRSGTSGLPSDVDDLAGYEALDDRSSFFSPEHEFADPDADPRTPVGRGERVGLTDGRAPFDLADILASLQTMREDVAGIEDEAQRKAATARFASEFVFQRMGVDGGEGEGTKG
ncbi:hypothetical protein EDB92DRAFT_1836349 [Lactarius akahatsu]|uniref:Uncharacterized protein n=1 Tax=Lactarius akahatsu TaxID=416441 RepID=A0AAD4QGY9_9AGAM|nr:hypothetical protein EDB92DRAFT_1836349 [Lactarius akahatsu]